MEMLLILDISLITKEKAAHVGNLSFVLLCMRTFFWLELAYQ